MSGALSPDGAASAIETARIAIATELAGEGLFSLVVLVDIVIFVTARACHLATHRNHALPRSLQLLLYAARLAMNSTRHSLVVLGGGWWWWGAENRSS